MDAHAELITERRRFGAQVGPEDGQSPPSVSHEGKLLLGVDGRLLQVEEARAHLERLRRRGAGQWSEGDLVVQHHAGPEPGYLVVRVNAAGLADMLPPPYADRASAFKAACRDANGAAVWILDVATKEHTLHPCQSPP